MAVYQTSDFRNGLKVEIDNAPWVMVYFQFVKPGKGTAFTRTKLKNMLTGSVIERTYRTGETLQSADVEEQPMQTFHQGQAFKIAGHKRGTFRRKARGLWHVGQGAVHAHQSNSIPIACAPYAPAIKKIELTA